MFQRHQKLSHSPDIRSQWGVGPLYTLNTIVQSHSDISSILSIPSNSDIANNLRILCAPCFKTEKLVNVRRSVRNQLLDHTLAPSPRDWTM